VEAVVIRRAISDERHWLLDFEVRPEEDNKAEGRSVREVARPVCFQLNLDSRRGLGRHFEASGCLQQSLG
jgi:hypothetical protein